jgi:hypothetical protein
MLFLPRAFSDFQRPAATATTASPASTASTASPASTGQSVHGGRKGEAGALYAEAPAPSSSALTSMQAIAEAKFRLASDPFVVPHHCHPPLAYNISKSRSIYLSIARCNARLAFNAVTRALTAACKRLYNPHNLRSFLDALCETVGVMAG